MARPPKNDDEQDEAALQAAEYEARVGMYHPKKRYVINLSLGNDNEPVRQFVGANGKDYLITRGRDVTVPGPVLEVLDNAILGVEERDPDDDTKSVTVQRKRFPYTIIQAL